MATDPYVDERNGVLRNRLGLHDPADLAAEHLESFATDVFRRLAGQNHLRGRGREEFVDDLADLLGDLNGLHPFREGNGRTVRAFVAQLARHAGHELRWAGLDADENVAASRASLAGDNGPLRSMLAGLVLADASDVDG